MKGIELPINILVIIAVAVIVLLGVIALYFSGFMGPAGIMTQNSAKEKYCAIIMRTPGGCTAGTVWTDSIQISDFDADRDGTVGDVGPVAANNFCWGTGSNDPLATCGAVASKCADTVAGAPEKDNLASLLACYYGITSESDALKACGCS